MPGKRQINTQNKKSGVKYTASLQMTKYKLLPFVKQPRHLII